MGMEKNKTNVIRQSRKHIVQGVRLINQSRKDEPLVEIENSEAFRDLVVPSSNPAIRKARNKGVAYTVVDKVDIIEVKGRTRSVVGRVAKSDVHLSKGMIYKLSK